VTAAHLLTRQTKGDDQQRYAAKLRLAKLPRLNNWSNGQKTFWMRKHWKTCSRVTE
jgi:hypothetical protein